MRSLLIAIAVLPLVALADGRVRESARDIPVVADVDVFVAGGTAAGVMAAAAAKDAGASVYLAGAHGYLGEDLAATLELGLDGSAAPQSDLARKLWRPSSGLAPFTYRATREPGGPWTYENDFGAKLAESSDPRTARDTMRHTADTSVLCSLVRTDEVARIEAVCFDRRDLTPPADQSQDAAARASAAKGGRGRTASVTATVLDGDLAGRTFRLGKAGTIWVDGDYKSGKAKAVVFSAEARGSFRKVRLDFEKDPAATCQFVSRIRFPLADPGAGREAPTPLKAKRLLDAELVSRGIGFITSSPVSDLLVDARGEVAGAVIANRSGRQAVRAKVVVDATAYGVTRLGRGLPGVGGEVAFTRVVKTAGARPAGARAALEAADEAEGLWRYRYKLPLADGSVRSLLRAASASDALTWTDDVLDQADLARLAACPPAPPRAHVLPLAGGLPLEARIAEGLAAGRAAAAAARARPSPEGVEVEVEDAGVPAAPGDTREPLGGFRAWEGRRGETVPARARALPVFARADVVVVGLGTSGAPAAVGAARAGAQTIGVEFGYVPGGVGTEGGIVGYYDGNRVGPVEEFNRLCATWKTPVAMYRRILSWRRMFADAGVEAWYGCSGEGAWTDEEGTVRGVVVVTPFGRGVVLAGSVVDATGNADIAAAAGAATEFGGGREFALQSAGQAPYRLGRCANSDFGYVNDTDALDVWLFSLKAREGALDAWDMSQILDSRERRRVVSDYMMQGWDVDARRPFPDTVVQTRSRHDSHGYLVDDYWHVQERKSDRTPRDLNVPFRSLLPKGLSNIAVVGLGAGVARDVMPMVRMQADLMNMGYAAGEAAARAARYADGDFRKVDVDGLKRRLVDVGALRPEVLGWSDDPEPTDAELAEAARTLKDGFRGAGVLWRCRERALPLLRAAYAEAETDEDRLPYAETLGLWGDGTGSDVLARAVARRPADVGLAKALGRGRGGAARAALLANLARLTERSALAEVRAACVGLEELGDPAAAPPLAAHLARPGVAGHDMRTAAEVPPMGGYGVGPHVDRSLVELSFARALLACGDSEGRGRATYERYARDVRGFLAAHAAGVLSRLGRP